MADAMLQRDKRILAQLSVPAPGPQYTAARYTAPAKKNLGARGTAPAIRLEDAETVVEPPTDAMLEEAKNTLCFSGTAIVDLANLPGKGTQYTMHLRDMIPTAATADVLQAIDEREVVCFVAGAVPVDFHLGIGNQVPVTLTVDGIHTTQNLSTFSQTWAVPDDLSVSRYSVNVPAEQFTSDDRDLVAKHPSAIGNDFADQYQMDTGKGFGLVKRDSVLFGYYRNLATAKGVAVDEKVLMNGFAKADSALLRDTVQAATQLFGEKLNRFQRDNIKLVFQAQKIAGQDKASFVLPLPRFAGKVQELDLRVKIQIPVHTFVASSLVANASPASNMGHSADGDEEEAY